nr:MAG TPA: hypothetical protein [Caudoviricetes sp.]
MTAETTRIKNEDERARVAIIERLWRSSASEALPITMRHVYFSRKCRNDAKRRIFESLQNLDS